MLIYDLAENGEHWLVGTLSNIPDVENDSDVQFVTVEGEDITAYLYDNVGDYSIRTDAGKLILVDEDTHDSVEFFGMVDGVIVVGKATEVEIVLNDVEHMHFAIDSEGPYVIGQQITLRAIPDEMWIINPSDGEEYVYAVINGERFTMELNPDNTRSVGFVIESDSVEIELDGKVEYDGE